MLQLFRYDKPYENLRMSANFSGEKVHEVLKRAAIILLLLQSSESYIMIVDDGIGISDFQ